MNKILQEKILWINSLNKASGTTNNFYYDIYGVLHPEAKNITFQLLDAMISITTVDDVFLQEAIMILFNFSVSHNQYSKSLNNFIIGGIISPMLISNNYSDQMIKEGPIYQIRSFPDGLINIRITNNSYVDLEDNTSEEDEGPFPPSRVILCLKFTYEI